MMFANELGETDLLLSPHLSSAEKAKWRKTLTGASNYLLRSHSLTFYTNGDIALGNALTFGLASKLTGESRYRRDYKSAWHFALHPPASTSGGKGLIYTTSPRQHGARHAAGYLTETGPGGTGYDAFDTQIQADFTANIYLYLGKAKALRLLNVITNKLLTRVDSSTWTLNTAGGTRHPLPNEQPIVDFDSSALTILVGSGERRSFAKYVAPQARAIADEAASAAKAPSAASYFELGSTVSSALLFDLGK